MTHPAGRPCNRCGGTLRPYAHWGICPNCDPSFYKSVFAHADITVRDLVGPDPFAEKGVPTRGGKKYVR